MTVSPEVAREAAQPGAPNGPTPDANPHPIRLMSDAGVIAVANALVAGLGLAGNVLLGHTLDARDFTAIQLFIVAFQFLQEAMGRSLNWAMLRLAPMVEAERPGGGDAVVHATRSLQHRFAVIGPLAVVLGAMALSHWIDAREGPSRVLILGLAGCGAAGAVMFSFGLSVLQLRERFLAMGSWMVSQSLLRVIVWLGLWATGALSLPTALGAHLATTAIMWMAKAASARRENGGRTAPGALAEDRHRVLHFGGRMVFATTLAALAAQIDVFLIDARTDDVTTAKLRVASLIAAAIELATSAVMSILLPHAGRASDAASQRRSLRNGLILGGVVSLGALATLPLVEIGIPILFPKYAAATEIYPILLFGVICTAMTDPLGLVFVSRDRPGRFVALNATLLLVVILGNFLIPGQDRALVAAWVRAASRAVLAAGIVAFLVIDSHKERRPRAAAPPDPEIP